MVDAGYRQRSKGGAALVLATTSSVERKGAAFSPVGSVWSTTAVDEVGRHDDGVLGDQRC
jgi:2,4-dienoyl-CoA reductase-like NADH-dependent reductase (Old Yellow Enzyme family)